MLELRHWLTNSCVCVASSPAARTKSNLLSLSSEELNTSLSQFVREVCRPNGERYSPDSVLYLCLGIQQVGTHTGTYSKGRNTNTAAVECEGKLTSTEAELSGKRSPMQM